MYDNFCENVTCRFGESVRTVYIKVWCVISLLHEKNKESSWMFDVLKSFCLTNHLQKGQISMSIMKCFIIKEHIVINDSLIYTVQKCKVKLIFPPFPLWLSLEPDSWPERVSGAPLWSPLRLPPATTKNTQIKRWSNLVRLPEWHLPTCHLKIKTVVIAAPNIKQLLESF